MKNYIICLAMAIIAISTAETKEAIISGRINQLMAKQVFVKEIDYYNMIRPGKTVDSTLIIDSTGYFSLKIKIDKPQKYFLMLGNFNAVSDLYVWPGDSLYFDIKFGTSMMTYEVSGKGDGSLANKLTTDFVKAFNVSQEMQDEYKRISESDSVDLLVKFITEHKDKQIEFIKQYDSNVPKEVKKDYINNIEYDWASTIIDRLMNEVKRQYQMNNVYWDHKKYSDNVLAKVKVNNPDAIKSYAYRAFIDKILMLRFFEFYFTKMKDGKEPGFRDSYQFLFTNARTIFKGVVTDIAVTGLFRDLLAEMKTKEDYEYAKAEFETYRKEASDKNFVAPVEKMFETQKPILGGMPAPQFTLPDSTGKMVSLSDFKGKVIYLDFWGTWCGPCRKEIPALKALHDKFENNPDIVFISVALERGDKETWKKFVAAQGLKGVQLFVDKSNREVSEKYRIESVPTFMLIDKNGIVANISAKRPSEPGIEEDIKKLLE